MRKADIRTVTPPTVVVDPFVYWAIVKGRRSAVNIAMEDYFVRGESMRDVMMKHALPMQQLANNIYRIKSYLQRCQDALAISGNRTVLYKTNTKSCRV